MTKEFKSQDPNSKRAIHITGDRYGVSVVIDGTNIIGVGARADVIVSPSDAPALMMAIAEAAGIEPTMHNTITHGTPEHLEDLAWGLHKYIRQHERVAKEAADREALEREAWKLYSAAPYTNNKTSFSELSREAQIQWTTIARTAREIHGASDA